MFCCYVGISHSSCFQYFASSGIHALSAISWVDEHAVIINHVVARSRIQDPTCGSFWFWELPPTRGERAPDLLVGLGEGGIFGDGNGSIAFAGAVSVALAYPATNPL